MRRKDRQITDFNDIKDIISRCDSCAVAFMGDDYPYVIPMNFGAVYGDNNITLYFHCASEGRKLDLIRKNNNVSFEMDCSHRLVTGKQACDYTMEFESVTGYGKAYILNDHKLDALRCIMNRYSADKNHLFDNKWVDAVTIIRIDVEGFTGKRLSTQKTEG